MRGLGFGNSVSRNIAMATVLALSIRYYVILAPLYLDQAGLDWNGWDA